jgi:alpha-glucoside transport system substrate-binding protein
MRNVRSVQVLVLVALTALLVAACGGTTGSSGTKTGGTVKVLATWGGSEQASFLAMVKPFEDSTGIKVQYEGTRDLNAVLTTRVTAGNPPDLAGLPGPGQMITFAKAGKLIALDNVVDQAAMKDQYGDSWQKLVQVNGKQYGIFIKAALKSLIWYDPKVFSANHWTVPKTYDELTALAAKIKSSGTAPWCMGVESGAASGWAATDWLEDLLLRQSGPQKYEDWFNGKLKWSSPEVKQAFQSLGAVVKDTYGGPNTILSTNFGDAGTPMFVTPPKCDMLHQASFITDFFVKANPALKPGEDFNFFAFPTINTQYAGAEEVAGDLFGMFKDTTQARQLMKYLTTPEAQRIWVKRGGSISPNKQVATSDYPDKLSQATAQILTSAKITEFDASDLMPDAMANAEFKGLLDFIGDQSKLDSVLATLDTAQASAYK